MIKLPKWTDERNIYIFAGIEIVMKRDLGEWYIKTERCNNCGKCCMSKPKGWTHGRNRKHDCKHLIFRANEYLCDLGADRPFFCSVSEGLPEDCNIKWKKL